MDAKSWQILGITSPTASCGKSVIAANLALSIARQPDRSVLLVDMDLQKPQIAEISGAEVRTGIDECSGRTEKSAECTNSSTCWKSAAFSSSLRDFDAQFF